MLMVYLGLDRAIRPMQKRGKGLFRVRRESYRVDQKNAPDRLLHAFPAMIAARWADIRLIAWLIETKVGCVRRNSCDYQRDAIECKWMHMMRLHTNLPLFLSSSFPLQPSISKSYTVSQQSRP